MEDVDVSPNFKMYSSYDVVIHLKSTIFDNSYKDLLVHMSKLTNKKILQDGRVYKLCDWKIDNIDDFNVIVSSIIAVN